MQIIKYSSPLNSDPFFELVDESNNEKEVFFRLKGYVKIVPSILRCVGYFDGKKRHSCPNNAINVRQCPTCKFRDISKIYTRFDFTGYEELEKQREEKSFAIYLTTFGEIVKAGITEASRLDRRIYEQGGKYYAKVAEFKGRKAYDFEYLLHTEFRIKGLMRKVEKIEAMKQDDRKGLEKLKEIVDMLREKIPDSLVENIEIKEHFYRTPKEFTPAPSNVVDGSIIGHRGQVFFSTNGTTYAYHAGNFLGFSLKELKS